MMLSTSPADHEARCQQDQADDDARDDSSGGPRAHYLPAGMAGASDRMALAS